MAKHVEIKRPNDGVVYNEFPFNHERMKCTQTQRNDVLNLMGRTATLTPEVEIESCPDYPRAFLF